MSATTTTPTAPTLRPYQAEAVDAAVQWHATHTGHCLLVLPTGAGKSVVLGALAADAARHGARALILAHRHELVAQNRRAVGRFLGLSEVGVVAAQEKRPRPVTVASIQTFGRHPYRYGGFDLVLVDEAHLIPHGSDGLYHRTLKALTQQVPDCRVVGLTATPYRLSSGRLDRGEGRLFTEVAYEADILRLIADGYLCPLTSRGGRAAIDTAGVATRGGEFAADALASRADDEATTRAIVAETLSLATGRRKVLVFATSVAHAEHLAAAFAAAGETAAAVHGSLSPADRTARLSQFAAGQLRFLVNCELLTTGYDEPAIDCLVLARPTQSPGLHVQMLGRGLRVHPDKQDTLVLDFAGNLERHGPIDAVRGPGERAATGEPREAPARTCPACQLILPTAVRQCPCGHEWPAPVVELAREASSAPALSTEPTPPQWHAVTAVEYSVHPPKPGKPPTLRVDYLAGYRRIASEWVCLEHDGYAGEKARRWWEARTDVACPETVEAAVPLAPDHLPTPLAIATTPDGRYTRITDYQWTEARHHDPAGLPRACWSCGWWSDVAKWCSRYHDAPPPDFDAATCPDYTDDLYIDAPF